MAGGKISRVVAIGTGTIGASWRALFLARGLTVAASDPAPGAEAFLDELCRRGLAEPRATVATTGRTALGGAQLPHRAGSGAGRGRVCPGECSRARGAEARLVSPVGRRP